MQHVHGGIKVCARPIKLSAALPLLALILMAWRYGEDIQTSNTAAHSTFHYELTRTLAAAAGFTREEAELIAVANEATDVGQFKGDTTTSPNVQITGTQRVSKTGPYWHFARRDSTNASGEYKYPGGRNTCAYFTRPTNSCQGDPELKEIEAWAVYGNATPSAGAPQVSINGGALQPVEGKSAVALAIYLHALADSYSHESCMAVEQFRGHKPRPVDCNARFWHEQAEYGPDTKGRNRGVPFTEEAGIATWLALKWFRQQNKLAGPARWTDAQAKEFIQSWIVLEKAPDRREFAVERLASLP
jgi:hypothetical protein